MHINWNNNTLITVAYIVLAFLAVIYITRRPLENQLSKLGKDMADSEIAAIEEESAATINQKLGGLDTINADNLLTGIRSDRTHPLVFQTRQIGRLPAKPTSQGGDGQTNLDAGASVWHGYSGNQPFPSEGPVSGPGNDMIEGFTSSSSSSSSSISGGTIPAPKLQLFYRMSCGHTQAFLPVWYEVVAALPLRTGAVRYEEINCEDASGACQAANIDGVPTLRLVTYKHDGSEDSVEEYPGARTFDAIGEWLGTRGIPLVQRIKVNPANVAAAPTMDDMVDMGASPEVTATVSSSSNTDNTTESFVGDQILDATGNLRRKHDQAYLDAAALDEHGHYHDVTDGCYDATFSHCQPNSQNPGYQIFTHRGQWGCVRPEPGTGIDTPFDAAFAVANQYLNALPPRQKDGHGGLHPDTDGDPSNGEESKEERQARMNRCARKHARQLRNFGLCDLEKLNEKYITPDEIRRGRLRAPMDDMTASDYEDASMSALAIYGACGAPAL